MSETVRIQGEIVEGENATIVARVVGASGSVITTGDVIANTGSFGTGIDLRLYDLGASDPTSPVYDFSGQSPTGIIVALVDPSPYGVPGGHSFIATITQSDHYFVGGRTYQAEYMVNTSTDGVIHVIATISVKGRITSSTG